MQWIFFALIAFGATLFAARKAVASNMETAAPAPAPALTLDFIFAKWGAQYNVDPDLLKAIAMRESNLDPKATRVNAGSKDFSVGLNQILCIPDDSGVCTNKFNIDGWPTTFQSLLDPDINVKMAAQILAWNLREYGFPRGVAVYNSWSARTAPINGPFPNQSYVDGVIRNLNKVKGYSK